MLIDVDLEVELCYHRKRRATLQSINKQNNIAKELISMVSTRDECDGIMAKVLSGRRRKKVAVFLVSLLPFVCIYRLHKKLFGGDITTYSDFFIHRHDTHIRGGGSSGGTSISFDRQKDIIDFNVDPLPRYAQDVIISLHNVEGSEGGGKGEKLCKGLLIRDDIILTSKECSTSSYVFDFPSVGRGESTL